MYTFDYPANYILQWYATRAEYGQIVKMVRYPARAQHNT